MKAAIKQLKLFAVFAAMSLALAGNVYSQSNSSDFVRIPCGSFQILDLSENQHTVSLTRAFFMCDHEVTQKEYQDIMGTNPSKFKANPDKGEVQGNRPVEDVSWFDAIEYCNRRSIKEGLKPCYKIKGSTDPDKWGDERIYDYVICDFNVNGYRLPTEAEWEYAARAGDNSFNVVYSGPDWSSGDNQKNLANMGDYVWYVINSRRKTHEVKKKKPNAFGLYDMSGNVEEWCWNRHKLYNWFQGTIIDPIVDDPDERDLNSGGIAVRGGGWDSRSDVDCSIGNHWEVNPHYKRLDQDPYGNPGTSSSLGFRVVRTDISTVTEAHRKQVKEQEEKKLALIKKDEQEYQERKARSEKETEEAKLYMAKELLSNGVPPEAVASGMGLDMAQINELLESIKK